MLPLFSHSVMSNSLGPHGLQHARLPCPSPLPAACSDSSQLSWWCHPTISSSVTWITQNNPFTSGSLLIHICQDFPYKVTCKASRGGLGSVWGILPCLPQCACLNSTCMHARPCVRYGSSCNEPGYGTFPQRTYGWVGKPDNKPATAVYNEEKPLALRGQEFEGVREGRQ